MAENPFKSPEAEGEPSRYKSRKTGMGRRLSWHLFGAVAATAGFGGSVAVYDGLQYPAGCDTLCFVVRLMITATGFAGCVPYARWYHDG
jgi:hypothetical protein